MGDSSQIDLYALNQQVRQLNVQIDGLWALISTDRRKLDKAYKALRLCNEADEQYLDDTLMKKNNAIEAAAIPHVKLASKYADAVFSMLSGIKRNDADYEIVQAADAIRKLIARIEQDISNREYEAAAVQNKIDNLKSQIRSLSSEI